LSLVSRGFCEKEKTENKRKNKNVFKKFILKYYIMKLKKIKFILKIFR